MSRLATDVGALQGPGSRAADQRQRQPGRRIQRWFSRREVRAVYMHQQGLWSCNDTDSTPHHFDTWPAWCEHHAGAGVDIVLAGALLHHLVVDDAALPLSSTQQIDAYARQQFALVHGPAALQWPQTVWSDGALYVACALHGLDLAALHVAARRHDVHLRHLRPWWTVAWQRELQTNAPWAGHERQALVLVHGDHATWVWSRRMRLGGVQQRRLVAPSAPALRSLLGELQLQHGVSPDATRVVALHLAGDARELVGACDLDEASGPLAGPVAAPSPWAR